jgi:hypothetical protein
LNREPVTSNRSITTPANGYTDITPPEKTNNSLEPSADIREYQSLIGKLNWVTRATRVDTAFATGKLAQFLTNPTQRHLGGAIRLLRYLYATQDYSVCYNPSKNKEILGYSDADYAGNYTTRRSTSGYLFTLAGGPITWVSKTQRSISTSTTEAEYTALSLATKEAIWIRRFLEQIRYYPTTTDPTTIYGDNQSALTLVKNPEFHSKTKHIDIAIHYTRERYEDKEIDPYYITTSEMYADCLTKPLGRQRLQKIVKELGYTSNNSTRSNTK